MNECRTAAIIVHKRGFTPDKILAMRPYRVTEKNGGDSIFLHSPVPLTGPRKNGVDTFFTDPYPIPRSLKKRDLRVSRSDLVDRQKRHDAEEWHRRSDPKYKIDGESE